MKKTCSIDEFSLTDKENMLYGYFIIIKPQRGNPIICDNNRDQNSGYHRLGVGGNGEKLVKVYKIR